MGNVRVKDPNDKGPREPVRFDESVVELATSIAYDRSTSQEQRLLWLQLVTKVVEAHYADVLRAVDSMAEAIRGDTEK